MHSWNGSFWLVLAFSPRDVLFKCKYIHMWSGILCLSCWEVITVYLVIETSYPFCRLHLTTPTSPSLSPSPSLPISCVWWPLKQRRHESKEIPVAFLWRNRPPMWWGIWARRSAVYFEKVDYLWWGCSSHSHMTGDGIMLSVPLGCSTTIAFLLKFRW